MLTGGAAALSIGNIAAAVVLSHWLLGAATLFGLGVLIVGGLFPESRRILGKPDPVIAPFMLGFVIGMAVIAGFMQMGAQSTPVLPVRSPGPYYDVMVPRGPNVMPA